MTLTAVLSQTTVSVRPGEPALLEVTVANTGSVVDRYSFTVLGQAAAWARVEPPTLTLMPGARGSVFVRLELPRSAEVAADEVPFAVKVSSQEDPAGSIVEEGVLRIGAFAEVFAELVPRMARGSRGARYRLGVDNRGNTRVNAVLSGADPNVQLAFSIRPPALVVEPGATGFSALRVRPGKAFWRGPPEHHQFQVVVEAEGQAPMLVDGTYVQEPVVAAWVLRAVVLTALLAVVLLVAWLALVKPAVTSAARTVVQEPLARTNAAVNEIGAAVGRNAGLPTEGEAVTQPEAAKGSPATTAPPAGAEPGTGAAAVTTGFGNPFDRRLAVDGPGTTEDSFTVEAGKVFLLTDVVFENPAGDTGTVSLRRGPDVVFRESLANFRNLDYHFVSPIVFDEGVDVVLQVDCRNVGPSCTAAVHLSGFIKTKPSS